MAEWQARNLGDLQGGVQITPRIYPWVICLYRWKTAHEFIRGKVAPCLSTERSEKYTRLLKTCF